MRRAVPLLVTVTLLAGACSGGSDNAADTTVALPDTVATTTEATTPPTEAPTTTDPVTSEAPTTTIDEAALLADAEAAYLEAFEVALETIRNPSAPDNETSLRDHFTGPNLEKAIENLTLASDGNFVAKVNPDNPSFATIVQPADFVDGASNEVLLGVCEFNSDRIYEVGTAPGGGDALRRDEPVSLLFAVRLLLEDGTWKSSVGTMTGEIYGEDEQCSSVS